MFYSDNEDEVNEEAVSETLDASDDEDEEETDAPETPEGEKEWE